MQKLRTVSLRDGTQATLVPWLRSPRHDASNTGTLQALGTVSQRDGKQATLVPWLRSPRYDASDTGTLEAPGTVSQRDGTQATLVPWLHSPQYASRVEDEERQRANKQGNNQRGKWGGGLQAPPHAALLMNKALCLWQCLHKTATTNR